MRIDEKASYPRPDWIRADYISLNGTWDFAFADGVDPVTCALDRKIRVPFPYQSPASMVGTDEYHPVVVYERTFALPESIGDRRVMLHFGAVDHTARVYVNGIPAGSHEGGYTPFALDVTDLLRPGENVLRVIAEDDDSLDVLRGKQCWDAPAGCHYVAVTGIWQEVWLEPVPEDRIESARFVPDFGAVSVTGVIRFSRAVHGTVTLNVTKDGADVCRISQTVVGRTARITVNLPDHSFKDTQRVNWSPARPNLFDADLTLDTGASSDTVSTYFGLRKVDVDGNRFYFNNSQLYLRMILAQGYWTEGIYRPADDDGYRADVEQIRALGFNCVRMHQKIEDPKFYYWADRLGLMVWGELPSFYALTERSGSEAVSTMEAFLDRDANHPSLIAWVPFNESWGLRKLLDDPRCAALARTLYYLCKSRDPSRIVSTNDGWENVLPSDILSVHDYRDFTPTLAAFYSDPAVLNGGAARTGHPYLLPGETYGGQPVMLTEFGGIWMVDPQGNPVMDSGEYLRRLQETMKNAWNAKMFCGYCYTQFTDTYQEQNGLVDMARQPKTDAEELRKLFAFDPNTVK